MNKAFQTYSPRVRRLKYDALLTDLGCQAISGNDFTTSKAFTRICVFEHDDASSIFNGDARISYATGPVNTGGLPPWPSRWAAWIASKGVRVGRYPLVTLPSNTLGSQSSLFGTLAVLPSKVSLGFTPIGQMGLAIQKADATIQVKWFKDSEGTYGNVTFSGASPVFFSNAIVSVSRTDLVLYYLRSAQPTTIFARFVSEDFGVEHIINAYLPVNLSKLLSSEAVSSQQQLYGIDSLGRDATLYSPLYAVEAVDKAEWETSIESGVYRLAAATGALPTRDVNAQLSLAVAGGIYDKIVVEPSGEPDLSGDAGVLSIGIESGSYE